jgi:hypothetical protein
LGRQYKDDLGVAANHHQDWTYYELSSTSSAVGLGALSGSTLQLTHAPSTYYYGFQVGERANNRNLDFGMSGWVFYNGIVQGNAVSGHGDFFANTTCCTPQTIDRTWSATDCAGNTVTHTQSITIGNTPPLAPSQPQPELPQLEAAYAGDESFQLTLRSTDRGQYTVEMFDMHGRKVSEVFSGAMDANSELTFHYTTQGLKNAFYFFKLSNGKAVTGSYSMMMR